MNFPFIINKVENMHLFQHMTLLKQCFIIQKVKGLNQVTIFIANANKLVGLSVFNQFNLFDFVSLTIEIVNEIHSDIIIRNIKHVLVSFYLHDSNGIQECTVAFFQ